MKYETDEFKNTVINIPAPEFDIDKAMQGHNRYVRKKKHYERLRGKKMQNANITYDCRMGFYGYLKCC